jgi:hypothetical protein
MLDHLGHALASWVLPVNAWTGALLACALLADHALSRRVRAGVRLALYAPVAMRVALPLSWRVPLAHAPAFLLAVDGGGAATAGGSSVSLPWYAVAGAAYLVVAACLAARALRRRAALAGALRSALPLTGWNTTWPVVRHPHLGPMVAGLWRPRIVVPEGMLAEEREEALHCAMRHEVAHLRRRDHWLSAALDALVVLAWPVLPVWIAASRVRQLVELACDEDALAGADASERRRYGHVLLDLAEHAALAAGELHFGTSLRARIEALAASRPWSRGWQIGPVAVVVVAMAACSSAGPSPTTTPSSGAETSESAEQPHPARLAPDVIQSVVRDHFGAYRDCYEEGLRRSPTLAGIVRVSFTIDRDGSVVQPSGEGSDLPDAQVVRCVVDGLGELRFPPPNDGTVTVVYPIQFSPDPK